MLAVRDAQTPAVAAAAGLDAAAVAVAVARAWAAGGRHVLIVDADAHGAGLAGRVAAAGRVALRPAVRGLPSLIAARVPLAPGTVAEHCWTLPTGGNGEGSVRLLGAPAHPAGAYRSAAWLAQRTNDLAALARRWQVIVSLPGPPTGPYEALGAAASQRLTADVTAGTGPPGGLRGVLSAFGLRFAPDPQLRLRVTGADAAAPGDAAAETAVRLVGGTRRVRPAVLLGARPRRRDRTLAAALDTVAVRLAEDADGADADGADGCAGSGSARLAAQAPAGVNGTAVGHAAGAAASAGAAAAGSTGSGAGR